jgi:hypothetical protein
MIIFTLVGFIFGGIFLLSSIFMLTTFVVVGIFLLLFAGGFIALGVWALGMPKRQAKKSPGRACYAITNRRVLVHPGTNRSSFFVRNLVFGSGGLQSYNGLGLAFLQRMDSTKYQGAGSLMFGRSVTETPTGAGLWAVSDVVKVEKLIRETLLHPVIDKVLRGEKLNKDEKGAEQTSAEEGEMIAPDSNIKDFGSRGALDDDPNIKAAPGMGSSGGKGGDDANVKGMKADIEYDPEELRPDVRKTVETELTEGETVKWVGWPEGSVQGRGFLGAVVGSAKRCEPNYYLYAITNRRVILWTKRGSKVAGTVTVTVGHAEGPITYYPPHLLNAGLEEDKRIPQGGNIVFKQVKVKIVTRDSKGRGSTRIEMHYFGLLRIPRYKAVARLLYETLIKPWVEN